MINGSYTMYRDLVLADTSGCVVATSKADDHAQLSSINVSDQSWFQQGCRISIGALGILFDWEELALPILQDCLPQHNGEKVPGGTAFYLNSAHAVIATTDNERFPLYSKVETGHDKEIGLGKSLAGKFSHNGSQYIIGSSCTQGYREYEELRWSAHVVRPI